jgi:hypothetical protein
MIALDDHSGCKCPNGTQLRTFPRQQEDCRCPQGQYWDMSISTKVVTCRNCAIGDYCEDGIRAKKCPDGWSTTAEGAVYLHDCSRCMPEALGSKCVLVSV